MPVYDHRYRGFDGERRTRAALPHPDAARARRGLLLALLLLLFVAACLPFLVCAALIYVANNVDAARPRSRSQDALAAAGLDRRSLLLVPGLQSSFAFFLASFIGPTLVGPDLAHDAMPLYLSRPLSRADYVAGKLGVLLVLLSAVTWVPGLLLVGLQASLARDGWLAEHWRIPFALFLGSWIWILLLALLALAISAWVRWRPVATGALFGRLRGRRRLRHRDRRDARHAGGSSWRWTRSARRSGRALRRDRVPGRRSTPPRHCRSPSAGWGCWPSCGAALLILHRKIRAYEVVR